MLRALAGALRILPGEGRTVALLSGYSFLIGIFQAYYISLANASFLAEFGVDYLPQGYMATGLAGYLIGAWLARMQGRIPFTSLIIRVLALPLVLVVLFWLGFLMLPARWLTFAMFAFIGPFIALVYFVFRTLVGRLLDLQQSKRLFGLISSGDVISSIIGFFSVPLVVGVLPRVTDLLLIAAAALGGACWLLCVVNRTFAQRLVSSPSQARRQVGLRDLLSDPYLRLICLLAVLVVFGFYFIDYAFLGQLRIRFEDRTFLARFISSLYGTIRVVELLVKTVLSGRLLQEYGIRLGLLALPLMLCVIMVLVALADLSLADSSQAIFLLVVLSKIIERVAMKSFHDPSFNVLYQPLAAEDRLAVQTSIEGLVQQKAVAFVGLILWPISWLGSSEVVLVAVFLIASTWAAVAVLLHREYRASLLGSLTARTRGASGDTDVRPSQGVALLQADLRVVDPGRVGAALDWLTRAAPASLGTALKAYLANPAPAARLAALRVIGSLRWTELEGETRRCLDGVSDPELKQAGRQTLARLETAMFERPGRGVAILAGSRDTNDRSLAARLLGTGAGADGLAVEEQQLLKELLRDEDAGVRRFALLAAGRVNSEHLLGVMAEQLKAPDTHWVAAEVLLAQGVASFPILLGLLADSATGPAVQARVVRSCAAIGGQGAIDLLAPRMNAVDAGVELAVLGGLRANGYQAASGEEQAYVRQRIEETTSRAAWSMASILDLSETDGTQAVLKALGADVDQRRERIFLLLTLIYEAPQVELVRDSFRSGDPDGRVYALELLDALLDANTRELIFPLLEDLTLNQRLKRLEPRCPQRRLKPVDRLKNVVLAEYSAIGPWGRVCALEALANLLDGRICDEQIAQLYHPNPMLREAAALGMQRADPVASTQALELLPEPMRDETFHILQAAGEGALSIAGKIAALKAAPLLARVDEGSLVDLALLCREVRLSPGASLLQVGERVQFVYLLVDGTVTIGEQARVDEAGSLLGEMVWGSSGEATLAIVAASPARLLCLGRDVMTGFLVEHPEAAANLKQAVDGTLLELKECT